MALSHRNILWAVFGVYVIVLFFGISHHELWGDEVHSWNIAKASAGYFDLEYNIRYEGHPPVWYTILWSISKFTHNMAYMQAAQFVIACACCFLVLFYSPFPLITRILIPFGYFFLFEYGVLSRNYAIGILPAFGLCVIMNREFRGRIILYYVLLAWMAHTHLLAIILAGSMHLYFLLRLKEQKKRSKVIWTHFFVGGLFLLIAFDFVSPPHRSELFRGLWKGLWDMQQFRGIVQSPLRSFLPVPAWWTYQFWDTQFLIEWKKSDSSLKYINPIVSLLLLAMGFFVLRKSRKALVLFGANLLVTFFVAMVVFALTRARYTGFIYVGFIVAYWLYCYEKPVSRLNNWLVSGLLFIHVIAGAFAVYRDIRYPFSGWYQLNGMLKKLPATEMVVCNYWAVDAVAAFTDKPCYCVDVNRKLSFAAWGYDQPDFSREPHRIYQGVDRIFRATSLQKIYLVSTYTPEQLMQEDVMLYTKCRVQLVDRTSDTPIEKDGFLYLYEIARSDQTIK